MSWRAPAQSMRDERQDLLAELARQAGERKQQVQQMLEEYARDRDRASESQKSGRREFLSQLKQDTAARQEAVQEDLAGVRQAWNTLSDPSATPRAVPRTQTAPPSQAVSAPAPRRWWTGSNRAVEKPAAAAALPKPAPAPAPKLEAAKPAPDRSLDAVRSKLDRLEQSLGRLEASLTSPAPAQPAVPASPSAPSGENATELNARLDAIEEGFTRLLETVAEMKAAPPAGRSAAPAPPAPAPAPAPRATATPGPDKQAAARVLESLSKLMEGLKEVTGREATMEQRTNGR